MGTRETVSYFLKHHLKFKLFELNICYKTDKNLPKRFSTAA